MMRLIWLTACLLAGLATAAAAQAGGSVAMTVAGGVDRPLDSVSMPLDNSGDPSVKVALAQITVAGGEMTAKLTTRIGLLDLTSDAPMAGAGDLQVRAATFYDNAGARYALGDGGATLSYRVLGAGRIALRYTAQMAGADGAPDASVTVDASAPYQSR